MRFCGNVVLSSASKCVDREDKNLVIRQIWQKWKKTTLEHGVVPRTNRAKSQSLLPAK